MNKYTFSTQSGKAYYYNSIPEFIDDSSENIIASLVEHSFEGYEELTRDQKDAWDNQINELQDRLARHGIDGDIIFEYDIVRLGKRIDVVLLIRHMVFSLEFKNGKKAFAAQDAQQAEDYAIDIKNFHKESEDLYVCPILIATNAKPIENQLIDCYSDKQVFLQKENIDSFMPKIKKISDKYGDSRAIDFEKWFNSPYYPTPTIIDAAIEAYQTHNLTDIAKSEAGQDDIDACEKELNSIIEDAKNNKKKCICFVTGVPGAGKTLVGLDIASHNLEKGTDNLSVYLSGNGPLVDVLREALAKSAKKHANKSKRVYNTAVKTFIQGSLAFKKDNSSHERPTAEHIMIFDEAQRVWNARKMKSKSNLDVSEPHLLIDIMNRQPDWAVIICLVGLGQDIYDGEVGINEWFRSAINDFGDWDLYYSPEIFEQDEDKNIDQEMIENYSKAHKLEPLHLRTSIRSFRADKQNRFVDALLDNRVEDAKGYYDEISVKYPIYITRDIDKAKMWAKKQVRGSQRCGVMACSSAQRLKPEGIYVPKNIEVTHWFLAPSDDIRSSNMMEIVASEFKVQGLEIDWAVVCWDADLRHTEKGWDYYNFRGSKWQHRHKEEDKRYLVNSYRVLLTRARQGMVIFVPKGVDEEIDPTRNHTYYDDIYAYLKSCGVKDLEF